MVDLDWLRREVQALFERHRVRELREWNGRQEVIYHSPSPIGFHSPWNLGAHLLRPWHVEYPHQWFWDSIAHAIVLSHIEPELAKEELRSLLHAQRQDGFIPHLIWNPKHRHWVEFLQRHLWPDPHTSPYLQPPALAQGVEAVYQRTGDGAFLKEVLPRVVAYYHYLDRERGRGDGLLEIIHSYESGKDRSPEYDLVYGQSSASPVWRGPLVKLMLHHRRLRWDIDRIFRANRFRVKDLLFNCVHAVNLRSVARLVEAAGEGEEAALFRRRAERAEEGILSKMYDPPTGYFYSLDSRFDRDIPLRVITVSSLFPLLLPTLPRERVEGLVSHLTHPGEFWLAYPIPAQPGDVPPSEKVIWRGNQTWIYPNWYLMQGLLLQAGRFPERAEAYRSLAQEITLRSYQVVRTEGFRECYHSRTGRGIRAGDFAWSTLVLDMVVSTSPPLSPSPFKERGKEVS